jgi:hypothetical protein
MKYKKLNIKLIEFFVIKFFFKSTAPSASILGILCTNTPPKKGLHLIIRPASS